MHILLIPSWYPSDESDISGVFFRDQALALHNYGHKVGVIAVKRRSLRNIFKKNEPVTSHEVDDGIFTYRRSSIDLLPRIPYGNYVLWKRAATKLLWKYIAEQGRPDVIHGHCALFGGAFAVEVGKRLRIPVVLTEHSSAFARGQCAWWQLKMAARASEGAAYCVAVSPSLGNVLSTKLPVVRDISWHWIPNIVADRFKYIESYSSSRKPNNIRFLNIAMMTENKGQRNLIKAFSLAFRGDDRKELWFAGDGAIRNELEEVAVDYGVKEQIKFLGRVLPQEIPSLLRESDVLAVSSHYETFGVVAAEALMVGKPVVATRCGGPDCIISERDGLLVEPNNMDEMALALTKIADNLGDYSAHEIHLYAAKRFSADSVAKQLTAVYESINRVKLT